MHSTHNLFIILLVFLVCNGISYGTEPEKDFKFVIDYDPLLEGKQKEVKEIVEQKTVIRYLRGIEFKIDESIMMFMVDNPVFLSATLRAMEIGDYVIEHEKDVTYSYDDGKGLGGKYDVVYSEQGERYFYGAGKYEGLILKLIGKGLVLTRFYTKQNYPHRIYLDANVYAKIENLVLRVLMKILKPIVIPLIDGKINRFIKDLHGLLEEITSHPEKIYKKIKESGHVNDKDLEGFRKLILEK